jgi:hypothetical protein
MIDLGRLLVVMMNLHGIVFKDLDVVWLKSMWDANESIRVDLLKIIFILYFIICRP